MSKLTPEFLKTLAQQQKLSEAPAVSHPVEQPPVIVVSSPFKFSAPPEDGVYIKEDYRGKATSKVTYKNGKKEGIQITYSLDGITVKTLTPYVNGVIEGVEKELHSNGQLQTVTPYKAGKKEGVATGYDEEGKVISTSFYANDELEGSLEVFGEDGLLIAKSTYTKGILNGPSIDYEKGIPTKISLYKNGHLIEIQTYNKGECILTQEINPPILEKQPNRTVMQEV